MKKILAALIVLFTCAVAFAQPGPGPQPGYFDGWQVSGSSTYKATGQVGIGTATPNSTNALTISPNGTGAGLNLVPGSAPASPNDGDLWTTSSGLFARIDGATQGPYSAFSGNNIILPNGGFLAQGQLPRSLCPYRDDASFCAAPVTGLKQGLIAVFDTDTPGTEATESAYTWGSYDDQGTAAKTASISAKWGDPVGPTAWAVLRINATYNSGAADDISEHICGKHGIWFFGNDNPSQQCPGDHNLISHSAAFTLDNYDNPTQGQDITRIFNVISQNDAIARLERASSSFTAGIELTTGPADSVTNDWDIYVRNGGSDLCFLNEGTSSCGLLIAKSSNLVTMGTTQASTLALGGASIGSNTLAVSGTGVFSSTVAVNGTTLNSGGVNAVFQVNGTAGALFVRNNGQEAYYTSNGSNYFGTLGSAASLHLVSGISVDAVILSSAQAVRFPAYGAGSATFDASGNITSVSDERLKTNIIPFTPNLAMLRQVKPIQYKWNPLSGNELIHTYAGFSAQNVRAAFGTYADEVTGMDKRGFYTLQDRALLAGAYIYAKALDTQQQADEAKIARLERIVASLSKRQKYH